MESINKYLVIYDVMLRQKHPFSLLKKEKYKYSTQRVDEFQTFADCKNLYTFIENVRTRNEQVGYARVVIKRIFTIASEMDQNEFDEFYQKHAQIWKQSYVGLSLPATSEVTVPEIIHDHGDALEKEILSKEPLFIEEHSTTALQRA